MPPTTIVDNEYATLWYHPGKKIVHHKFHQFVQGERFREILNQGADIFQKYGAHKWLSDDRANSALPPEDGEWAMVDWHPRVIAAGWKYWAIVMPEKTVGKMNMRQFAKQNAEAGVTVQVFSDPDEAMAWLERQ